MNTKTRHLTIIATLATLAALAVFPLVVRAADFSTDFTNTSNFTNNFVFQTASGAATFDSYTLSGATAPILRKKGTGSQSAILKTGESPDLFDDVTITADVRFSGSGPSIGLYSRVGTDGKGYVGLIDIKSATSVQFRIYDSDSNAASSGVGTARLTETVTLDGVTLSYASFYTISFTTITMDSNTVKLTLTLSSLSGDEIASRSYSDTTSPVLTPGQVGFRTASETLYINNFSATTVSTVPEPATTPVLIAAAALAFLACTRPRRATVRKRR